MCTNVLQPPMFARAESNIQFSKTLKRFYTNTSGHFCDFVKNGKKKVRFLREKYHITIEVNTKKSFLLAKEISKK